ncbi:hypothetical protein JCM10213_007785 [Rhodosporidiobolus nylandii]
MVWPGVPIVESHLDIRPLYDPAILWHWVNDELPRVSDSMRSLAWNYHDIWRNYAYGGIPYTGQTIHDIDPYVDKVERLRGATTEGTRSKGKLSAEQKKSRRIRLPGSLVAAIIERCPNLEDVEFEPLAAYDEQSGTIKKIRLHLRWLGEPAFACILPRLAEACPNLVELDLRRAYIHDSITRTEPYRDAMRAALRFEKLETFRSMMPWPKDMQKEPLLPSSIRTPSLRSTGPDDLATFRSFLYPFTSSLTSLTLRHTPAAYDLSDKDASSTPEPFPLPSLTHLSIGRSSHVLFLLRHFANSPLEVFTLDGCFSLTSAELFAFLESHLATLKKVEVVTQVWFAKLRIPPNAKDLPAWCEKKGLAFEQLKPQDVRYLHPFEQSDGEYEFAEPMLTSVPASAPAAEPAPASSEAPASATDVAATSSGAAGAGGEGQREQPASAENGEGASAESGRESDWEDVREDAKEGGERQERRDGEGREVEGQEEGEQEFEVDLREGFTAATLFQYLQEELTTFATQVVRLLWNYHSVYTLFDDEPEKEIDTLLDKVERLRGIKDRGGREGQARRMRLPGLLIAHAIEQCPNLQEVEFEPFAPVGFVSRHDPSLQELDDPALDALCAVGSRITDVTLHMKWNGEPAYRCVLPRLVDACPNLTSLDLLRTETEDGQTEYEPYRESMASLSRLHKLEVFKNLMPLPRELWDGPLLSPSAPLRRIELHSCGPDDIPFFRSFVSRYSVTLDHLSLRHTPHADYLPDQGDDADPTVAPVPFPLPNLNHLSYYSGALHAGWILQHFAASPLETVILGDSPCLRPKEVSAFLDSHKKTLDEVVVEEGRYGGPPAWATAAMDWCEANDVEYEQRRERKQPRYRDPLDGEPSSEDEDDEDYDEEDDYGEEEEEDEEEEEEEDEDPLAGDWYVKGEMQANGDILMIEYRRQKDGTYKRWDGPMW